MRNPRQSLFGAAVAISVAALTLGTGVTGAGAHSAAAPPGYIVVGSPADVTVAAGTQTHAEVSCPAGTLPVSGGATTPGNDLAVTMNSSHPTGKRSWAVDMNDSGAAASTMRVHAVCINRPAAQFTVTTATFSAPPNAQSVGAVACPSGVVVGGGVRSSTSSTAVNIDTLYPSSTGTWTAWMNNASATASTFDVTAICKNKKPAGYARLEGKTVSNPAGQLTYSNVTCRGARVPLGGGIYSDGSGLHQNLATSGAQDQFWYNFYVNADATANTIHSWAICAGN